jgi:hypothetical protein
MWTRAIWSVEGWWENRSNKMTQQSDEDKLIGILQDHRNLKYWVMQQLQDQGIECQETYGNHPDGDIALANANDVQKVQTWAMTMQQRFNPNESSVSFDQDSSVSGHYVEIKTTYLCGQEVECIIAKETVIAVVSAGKISRPSQKRFVAAGIRFVANVARGEFS